MKIELNINGMHCNSCSHLIENELKDKVNKISVSYSREKAEIDFDENKISKEEIINEINKLGYNAFENKTKINEAKKESNTLGWIVAIGSIIFLAVALYYLLGIKIPYIQLPLAGENYSLLLLFAAGLVTGFHCVAMCGGFVISYTANNAIKGHKSFKQHLVYGSSKVISYAIIGGLFGLIGGIIAFSAGLRGWVAILAGVFMIVYALGMLGIKFFRAFQFKGKFLSNLSGRVGMKTQGVYLSPLVTGLLNGLFIACGPLQAMYLYAAGTGSFFSGAVSLAVFGLGTLPVMLGFGSLASVISHKTTGKILKISAIIVIVLGLIMLNRGLTLTGNNVNFDSIKAGIIGSSSGMNSTTVNGVQIIKMNVDASGYSPNSFVLKKGVPVKWEVNVVRLTGCNSELVSNTYGINKQLKQGLQTIEFTPDKTGNFQFSCGMGMLRGSFIVTDTGTATQQQVKSASPPKGMQCGGSGGGGCGCGG